MKNHVGILAFATAGALTLVACQSQPAETKKTFDDPKSEVSKPLERNKPYTEETLEKIAHLKDGSQNSFLIPLQNETFFVISRALQNRPQRGARFTVSLSPEKPWVFLNVFQILNVKNGHSTVLKSPLTNEEWIQSATKLNAKNDILLIGGNEKSHKDFVKIYNPSTTIIQSVENWNYPMLGRTAILLDNGAILLAGGADRSGKTGRLEIFDPKDKKFHLLTSSIAPKTRPLAIKTLDGKVYFFSNSSEVDNADLLIEIFDPTNYQVSTAEKFKGKPNSLVLLPNNQILVTTFARELFIYTPQTKEIEPIYYPQECRKLQPTPPGEIGAPNIGRRFPPEGLQTFKMPDGRVLIADLWGNNRFRLNDEICADFRIFDYKTKKLLPIGKTNMPIQAYQTSFYSDKNNNLFVISGDNVYKFKEKH